jgi:predicted PurR-regulated permease PerM
MVTEAAIIAARLVKLSALLLLAAVAYWALRQTPVFEFTARERDGLGTLILLIGNIYAVMFAFVIFVIWGQFQDVENFVMRECNSLNELLRFSEHLDPESSRVVRRAVDDYAHRVAKSEWQALAERRRDRQTEKAFSELMSAIIEMSPAAGQEAAHQRLIEIGRRAGEHRDERVTKSLTRVPTTLERLVKTMAAALLVLVFVYPFQHWLAGLASFCVLAVVLFLANLVMTDTDNPFHGICNVSPKPFLDLVA